MGIYIQGMEMPRRGMVVNIYGDGRVTNHFDEFGKTIGKAVPVPPHGRSIDADALMDIYNDRQNKIIDRYGFDSSENGILAGAMKLLSVQPTVIEAER